MLFVLPKVHPSSTVSLMLARSTLLPSISKKYSSLWGDCLKQFYVSLTNLQDRQRAPKQQITRWLEIGARIDLSLSEISDEKVDYGSSEVGIGF